VTHGPHKVFRCAGRTDNAATLVRDADRRPAVRLGLPGFDETGALADDFEAQFGFVVRNIKRVLDEAGASFRDLVKVNVLLTRAF
jgi:hypothetical protein